MLTFGVLVYDGFDELDVIAPYETLRVGKRFTGELDAHLVRLSEKRIIRGHHETELNVTLRLDEQRFDWLIVPGGGWATRSESGAWSEFQRGELPKLLHAANREGTKMASVCTGAMLLAKAGLTIGRPATTHQCARADLEATGTVLVDARVVDDGDLVTSGGVTSGLDLGIWLVERFAGTATRSRVETSLEYTSTAKVHFGPNGRYPVEQRVP